MPDSKHDPDPDPSDRAADEGVIPPDTSGRTAFGWYLAGTRMLFSIPALILMASFVGFGGLVREGGWTVGQAAMMTAFVWALPSKVVFVGSIAGGLSLAATALAVSLSAVRLMPMTVALLPILKSPTTPRWQLFALSQFIAVTAWVVALRLLPTMPREARIPFFVGMGSTLVIANIGVTVGSFYIAGELPPTAAAGLFFLTPIYFLISLYAAAQTGADYLALGAGLVLGPVFHIIEPQFDLLWAGLIGGTLAYVGHRLIRRWRMTSGHV